MCEEHYIQWDRIGAFIQSLKRTHGEALCKVLITPIDPDDPYEKHMELKGSHARVQVYLGVSS